MERIAMSQEERDYLNWLKRAKEGNITQREAALKMGVSDRWVRTLLERMDRQGDLVVVHGLRGKPSNRKLPDKTKRQALAILKQPDWHDFGPTFAAEQLAKQHQIHVGKETLRGWMIEGGAVEAHDARHRRSARMAAAAKRVWGIGAVGYLGARLAGRKRAGSLPGAHDRRRHELELGPLCRQRRDPAKHGSVVGVPGRNGRMVDVYTDRDSMFVVPPRPGESTEQRRETNRLTQLGRGLRELGI